MQELTQLEIAEVSGAACDTCNGGSNGGVNLNLDAAASGFFKGALYGASMLKFGAGGFGFGALAQLVGVFVTPALGATLGAGLGLITDKATVDNYFDTLSQSFGPGK